MLTAGCLFQTIWNLKSGDDPEHGIKDYDFFFDDRDLSWEAENEVIIRTRDLLSDLASKVEVKNQARVHLWHRWQVRWAGYSSFDERGGP